MEQPITSDMTVEERMEGLQDELRLLKSEIRQTLIDLREFMMKGSAFSVSSATNEPMAFPSRGQETAPIIQGVSTPNAPPDTVLPAVVEQAGTAPAVPSPDLQNALNVSSPAPGSRPLDAVKMGNIIRWFGTVARRGMSPRQLKPFLETYEQSGHLTPAMAILTYKSLEELEYAQGGSNKSYSPSEYSQCLLELHEIICNPGYSPSTTDSWESSVDKGPHG